MYIFLIFTSKSINRSNSEYYSRANSGWDCTECVTVCKYCRKGKKNISTCFFGHSKSKVFQHDYKTLNFIGKIKNYKISLI